MAAATVDRATQEPGPARAKVDVDDSIKQFLGLQDIGASARDRRFLKNLISQTRMQERLTMYALAKHHYSGEGEIFDLGTSTGGSAACLALGLSKGRSERKVGRVHTFDRFSGYAVSAFNQRSKDKQFATDFEVVRETIGPVQDYVVVHQTDLAQPFRHLAGAQFVEIAHIDVAKTIEVWASIVSDLVPAIIPDRTVWILQDFAQVTLPFLVYGMECLRQHGHFIGGSAPGAAMCFRFAERPAPEVTEKIVADRFSLDEKLALVETAFDHLARSYGHLYGQRSDVESCRIATSAFCYYQAGEAKRCRELLETVSDEYRGTLRWRRAMQAVNNKLREPRRRGRGGRLRSLVGRIGAKARRVNNRASDRDQT